MVELGDLWAGEQRKLVLTLRRAGQARARARADRRARAALRRAARPRRADGHDPGPRQRRPRRPGRRPDPRPEGPHRARLPAGAGRQAQGRRRARARRPRRGARAAYESAGAPLAAAPPPTPSSPTRSRSSPSSRAVADGEAAWVAEAQPHGPGRARAASAAAATRDVRMSDVAAGATRRCGADMTRRSCAASSPPATRVTATGAQRWWDELVDDNFDRVRGMVAICGQRRSPVGRRARGGASSARSSSSGAT